MNKLIISLLMIAGLAGPAACAPPPKSDAGWAPVAVTQAPASPAVEGVGEKFGALTFAGGVRLTSADPTFGGWSSIKIGPDGALVAISDAGSWMTATIVTDAKSGAFAGLADVRTALMRGENGDPLDTKVNADAEGLALLPDGRFAVSLEQKHRILIFDLAKDGPVGKATLGPPVPDKKLKPNEGLEALVSTPNGDLLGGSEYAPPGEKNSIFMRLKIGAPEGEALVSTGQAQTASGFALVDMDRLADGNYVALERFYFPGIGNKSKIRVYSSLGLEVANPPALKGDLLAEFAPPLLLDNFEGIAAAPKADGGTRLYIMSDDNFSEKQKTLIYAFDMAAPVKAKPPAKPAH